MQPESKLGFVILSAIIVVISQGCEKNTPIPAVAITGTYTSHSGVYFFNQSDSCTLTYASYDSTPVAMTWTLTYSKDNLVNVLISGVPGTTVKIDSACQLSSQYYFPVTLHGVVGSTDLIVERQYTFYDTTTKRLDTAYYQLGDFSVAGSSLTGSLVDLQCDTVHCYGYKTKIFTMTKQE